MTRLGRDLMVVFGFSAENAAKAEDLWRAGRLPSEFNYAMQNLLYRPWDRMNPIDQRSAPDNLMSRLNFKLSTGEIQ